MSTKGSDISLPTAGSDKSLLHMKKLVRTYFEIAEANKSDNSNDEDSVTDDDSLSSDGNSEADIKESFLWN